MISNEEAILRQVLSKEVIYALQFRKVRDLEKNYDSVLRTMIQICKKHDFEQKLNQKYCKKKVVMKQPSGDNEDGKDIR